MSRRVRALAQWLLLVEGSTRAVALIRIGLVLLIWSRWGSDFLFYRADSTERWIFSLSYDLSTVLMLVGLASRVTTAWTGITLMGIVYELGLRRGIYAYAHHHAYALAAATCLLALTPCGGSFSLDRWLAVRRARKARTAPPAEWGDLWATRLIMAQLSAIYLWGAYGKLTYCYLSGQRLGQIYVAFYTPSDYPQATWFAAACMAAAIASVVVEVALGVGLWLPDALCWIIPMGICFHAILYCTLPVLTFSATMGLLYLACVPAHQVHAFIDDLLAPEARPADMETPSVRTNGGLLAETREHQE